LLHRYSIYNQNQADFENYYKLRIQQNNGQGQINEQHIHHQNQLRDQSSKFDKNLKTEINKINETQTNHEDDPFSAFQTYIDDSKLVSDQSNLNKSPTEGSNTIKSITADFLERFSIRRIAPNSRHVHYLPQIGDYYTVPLYTTIFETFNDMRGSFERDSFEFKHRSRQSSLVGIDHDADSSISKLLTRNNSHPNKSSPVSPVDELTLSYHSSSIPSTHAKHYFRVHSGPNMSSTPDITRGLNITAQGIALGAKFNSDDDTQSTSPPPSRKHPLHPPSLFSNVDYLNTRHLYLPTTTKLFEEINLDEIKSIMGLQVRLFDYTRNQTLELWNESTRFYFGYYNPFWDPNNVGRNTKSLLARSLHEHQLKMENQFFRAKSRYSILDRTDRDYMINYSAHRRYPPGKQLFFHPDPLTDSQTNLFNTKFFSDSDYDINNNNNTTPTNNNNNTTTNNNNNNNTNKNNNNNKNNKKNNNNDNNKKGTNNRNSKSKPKANHDQPEQPQQPQQPQQIIQTGKDYVFVPKPTLNDSSNSNSLMVTREQYHQHQQFKRWQAAELRKFNKRLHKLNQKVNLNDTLFAQNISQTTTIVDTLSVMAYKIRQTEAILVERHAHSTTRLRELVATLIDDIQHTDYLLRDELKNNILHLPHIRGLVEQLSGGVSFDYKSPNRLLIKNDSTLFDYQRAQSSKSNSVIETDPDGNLAINMYAKNLDFASQSKSSSLRQYLVQLDRHLGTNDGRDHNNPSDVIKGSPKPVLAQRDIALKRLFAYIGLEKVLLYDPSGSALLHQTSVQKLHPDSLFEAQFILPESQEYNKTFVLEKTQYETFRDYQLRHDADFEDYEDKIASFAVQLRQRAGGASNTGMGLVDTDIISPHLTISPFQSGSNLPSDPRFLAGQIDIVKSKHLLPTIFKRASDVLFSEIVTAISTLNIISYTSDQVETGAFTALPQYSSAMIQNYAAQAEELNQEQAVVSPLIDSAELSDNIFLSPAKLRDDDRSIIRLSHTAPYIPKKLIDNQGHNLRKRARAGDLDAINKLQRFGMQIDDNDNEENHTPTNPFEIARTPKSAAGEGFEMKSYGLTRVGKTQFHTIPFLFNMEYLTSVTNLCKSNYLHSELLALANTIITSPNIPDRSLLLEPFGVNKTSETESSFIKYEFNNPKATSYDHDLTPLAQRSSFDQSAIYSSGNFLHYLRGSKTFDSIHRSSPQLVSRNNNDPGRPGVRYSDPAEIIKLMVKQGHYKNLMAEDDIEIPAVGNHGYQTPWVSDSADIRRNAITSVMDMWSFQRQEPLEALKFWSRIQFQRKSAHIDTLLNEWNQYIALAEQTPEDSSYRVQPLSNTFLSMLNDTIDDLVRLPKSYVPSHKSHATLETAPEQAEPNADEELLNNLLTNLKDSNVENFTRETEKASTTMFDLQDTNADYYGDDGDDSDHGGHETRTNIDPNGTGQDQNQNGKKSNNNNFNIEKEISQTHHLLKEQQERMPHQTHEFETIYPIAQDNAFTSTHLYPFALSMLAHPSHIEALYLDPQQNDGSSSPQPLLAGYNDDSPQSSSKVAQYFSYYRHLFSTFDTKLCHEITTIRGGLKYIPEGYFEGNYEDGWKFQNESLIPPSKAPNGQNNTNRLVRNYSSQYKHHLSVQGQKYQKYLRAEEIAVADYNTRVQSLTSEERVNFPEYSPAEPFQQDPFKLDFSHEDIHRRNKITSLYIISALPLLLHDLQLNKEFPTYIDPLLHDIIITANHALISHGLPTYEMIYAETQQVLREGVNHYADELTLETQKLKRSSDINHNQDSSQQNTTSVDQKQSPNNNIHSQLQNTININFNSAINHGLVDCVDIQSDSEQFSTLSRGFLHHLYHTHIFHNPTTYFTDKENHSRLSKAINEYNVYNGLSALVNTDNSHVEAPDTKKTNSKTSSRFRQSFDTPNSPINVPRFTFDQFQTLNFSSFNMDLILQAGLHFSMIRPALADNTLNTYYPQLASVFYHDPRHRNDPNLTHLFQDFDFKGYPDPPKVLNFDRTLNRNTESSSDTSLLPEPTDFNVSMRSLAETGSLVQEAKNTGYFAQHQIPPPLQHVYKPIVIDPNQVRLWVQEYSATGKLDNHSSPFAPHSIPKKMVKHYNLDDFNYKRKIDSEIFNKSTDYTSPYFHQSKLIHDETNYSIAKVPIGLDPDPEVDDIATTSQSRLDENKSNWSVNFEPTIQFKDKLRSVGQTVDIYDNISADILPSNNPSPYLEDGNKYLPADSIFTNSPDDLLDPSITNCQRPYCVNDNHWIENIAQTFDLSTDWLHPTQMTHTIANPYAKLSFNGHLGFGGSRFGSQMAGHRRTRLPKDAFFSTDQTFDMGQDEQLVGFAELYRNQQNGNHKLNMYDIIRQAPRVDKFFLNPSERNQTQASTHHFSLDYNLGRGKAQFESNQGQRLDRDGNIKKNNDMHNYDKQWRNKQQAFGKQQK
jgi:hypothetical protein